MKLNYFAYLLLLSILNFSIILSMEETENVTRISQNENDKIEEEWDRIDSEIELGEVEQFKKNKTLLLVKWALNKAFYAGFKQLDPAIVANRRNELLENYDAQVLHCVNRERTLIDAIYISSPSHSRTGNVLVICLNKMYQDQHPCHWEIFLENGADIVLWNPVKLGAVNYSKDLYEVLKTLRRQDPHQVIAVKTYCANTDPGIKAIADLNDKNVHLILDRGHGNAKALARSFTIFAKLPIVQTILQEEFYCDGINKIKNLKGKILFIYSALDQMMNYGEKNFTKDLYELRKDQSVIMMKSQDHWNPWDYNTYDKVLFFLSQLDIVQKNYEEVSENKFPIQKPSCLKKKWVPFLTKSYF